MTLTHEWEEFLEEQHKIKREVWQKRGLTFDTEFLFIPYNSPKGDLIFQKRRREPNFIGPNKYLYPTGSHITLYPSHDLSSSEEWILTEGELDTLTLESYGMAAVTAGGVTSFKKELAAYFQDKKVYTCFDNDEKGKEGTERAAQILLLAGIKVKIIDLPEMKDGKDIGDYFRLGHTKEDFLKLIDNARLPIKLSKSDTVSNNSGIDNEVDTASINVNLLSYSEWKLILAENFPQLIFPAEVAASLFGQLLIKDVSNPCALVFIDMPSAGKTIILNMFCGNEWVYSTDSFTAASFVSQAANVKPEKLKEVDLLPKIRNKVLVIRDLAPFFGQRDDDLLKNMGILTRVLDGEGLELHAGTHGSRGYRGDYLFMILAASTPIPPKAFKLMGNLGSRLFFHNLRSKQKDEDTLTKQLKAKSWKTKQSICIEATQGFLKSLFEKYPDRFEWDIKGESDWHLNIISRCGLLLSRLRGTINLWKEDYGSEEFAYQEPIIEMPDRITQILFNLARGHALIAGRTKISNEDIQVIINVALDSAPLSRTRLFRFLIDYSGEVTTEQVMGNINCSRPTALKEMEILKILGLVNLKDGDSFTPGRPEKIMSIREDLVWFTNKECTLLRESGLEEEVK